MVALAKYLKLPDAAVSLLESNLITYTVLLAIVGVIMAFWGYKFIKISLVIGSAAGAGVATNLYLVPLFADKVGNISMLSTTGLAIAAAAAIGAVIAFKAPRFIVFCGSAAAGYFYAAPFACDFVTKTFSKVSFFESKLGTIIISALAALILAAIVSLLFKVLFILGTSFGGAILVVCSVFSLIFTKSLAALVVPAVAFIVVVAVAGIICQYIRGDGRLKPLYY